MQCCSELATVNRVRAFSHSKCDKVVFNNVNCPVSSEVTARGVSSMLDGKVSRVILVKLTSRGLLPSVCLKMILETKAQRSIFLYQVSSDSKWGLGCPYL